MSLIDTLIKKVEELTRAVNSIRSSSKKIHDLPEISGEDIYVAASNGAETGKFLLSNFSQTEPNIFVSPWKNIDLTPASSFFIDDKNSNYNFVIENDMWSNNTPNIKGFKGENPSDGLIGYLRNGSDLPINLRHNLLNGPEISIPFFLSNGLDYQMSPNEILSFKYSKERNQCEFSVYNSGGFLPLQPITEIFQLSESDLSQPNITLNLKAVPSKNDFIDVYINGIFINPDDLITIENVLIIAKSNIDYSIKEGMKVTVNYKY